jgi:hypothetical protein
MEKSKSLEKLRDGVLQAAKFAFLVEGQKVVSAIEEIIYPTKRQKSLISDTKFTAKWTPPTLLNLPLEVDRAPAGRDQIPAALLPESFRSWVATSEARHYTSTLSHTRSALRKTKLADAFLRKRHRKGGAERRRSSVEHSSLRTGGSSPHNNRVVGNGAADTSLSGKLAHVASAGVTSRPAVRRRSSLAKAQAGNFGSKQPRLTLRNALRSKLASAALGVVFMTNLGKRVESKNFVTYAALLQAVLDAHDSVEKMRAAYERAVVGLEGFIANSARWGVQRFGGTDRSFGRRFPRKTDRGEMATAICDAFFAQDLLRKVQGHDRVVH